MKIHYGGSNDENKDKIIWSSKDGIKNEELIKVVGSSGSGYDYIISGTQIFLDFESGAGYGSEKIFSASIFFGILV